MTHKKDHYQLDQWQCLLLKRSFITSNKLTSNNLFLSTWKWTRLNQRASLIHRTWSSTINQPHSLASQLHKLWHSLLIIQSNHHQRYDTPIYSGFLFLTSQLSSFSSFLPKPFTPPPSLRCPIHHITPHRRFHKDKIPTSLPKLRDTLSTRLKRLFSFFLRL